MFLNYTNNYFLFENLTHSVLIFTPKDVQQWKMVYTFVPSANLCLNAYGCKHLRQGFSTPLHFF